MKASFTLAETLITIAIIGIVISMTLPAVILNYQKKTTLVKLKKAYSILQQVLERSSYEYGGNMSSFVTTGNKVTEETTKAFINTFWLPYFDSPYVSQEGTFPYGKSVPYSGFNNTVYNTSVTTSYKDGRFFFTTKDGLSYYIFTLIWVHEKDEQGNIINSTMTYASNMQIFVDINGVKGENKLGKDVFIFILDTTKNKIYPYGYNNNTATITRNCSTAGNGTHCSAKIINDGWEINYY